MNTIPLFHTKLMVPGITNTELRRAKLTKKLKAIIQYPLTIVHAGPGYGKSTALALQITDENRNCCWYTISEKDNEILSYLAYFIASIRTYTPNFGMKFELFIKQNPKIEEQNLELLCSIFINEVVSAKQELIIILDDYHKINQSYLVNKWMGILLEHIPKNLHLVIISRSRPSIQPIPKMIANRQCLEITTADLVLTREEVDLLLNDQYQISVSEKNLNSILQLTEGWVIGVRMVSEIIQVNGGNLILRETTVETLTRNIFLYFSIEVFEKETSLIQQFLGHTSILEEMNEEVCKAVSKRDDAGSILEELIEKNIFIQKTTEKQYRYHPLFKQFLETQLQEKQQEDFCLMHNRAGHFFEEKDMIEKALYHYEKINHTNKIAGVLEENGLVLLENGKLESLYERLSRLPNSNKDLSWFLWFLQGEILRYRSQYKEAEECYQNAVDSAEKINDIIGKSKALEGKAKIFLDTIQPFRAERLLYEVIELLEQSNHRSEMEIAKLYQLLAENLLNFGHGTKAEKWLHRAKKQKVPLVDRNIEARLYLRTGRFEKAKKILFANIEKKVHGRSALPQSHRETALLLSLIESLMGNGESAKDLAQAGIQHGLSLKSPFVEACGWIRLGHSAMVQNKYDVELAVNCYDAALEIMDNLNVDRGKAEAWMALTFLYGSKGDYQQAIKAGMLALKETEKVKDMWLSSLITLNMGIVAIYSNHRNEAIQHLKKANLMFLQCEDMHGQMLSYFWLAYSYHQSGEKQLFIEYFSAFLKIVHLGEFEFFLQKRTLFGPNDLQVFAPLLLEAQKQNVLPDFTMKMLQKLKLVKIEAHPGYTLRVHALGGFRVWLGEKEVQDRDWQRGKARELFQLFITNRHNLICKEEIYQLLWPGQEEKSAMRDFKVALNALNSVLEPNRKARANSFFIIREGTAYGLNPHAGLEIDTVLFEQWIISGLEEKDLEKAMDLLQKGLKIYTGYYLPERRYDDWCLNERSRFQELFLRGAERVAQLSVRKEDYETTIDWCQKIIDKDKTWEEAYRLLMYSYYRKNNRPQAIKSYQKCCEILQKELGVAPMEPTIQLYEMIRQY